MSYHPISTLLFLRRLPNGNETGKFLSLDLGGTNFRVIVMEITEDREFLMDSKIYAVPEDVMTGKGASIYDVGHYGATTDYFS